MMANFEVLYKANYSILCRTANNIINDSDEAKDIVQDVFLKLWRKKDELDSILNQKAYLFKSVINASISYLEKNKFKNQEPSLTIEAADSADSSIRYKELESKIHDALNQLPAKCKTIFVLSRFEDMKYQEIAEHLGISIKTVENQMGIALKKIRITLSPYLKDYAALAIGTGLAFFILSLQ